MLPLFQILGDGKEWFHKDLVIAIANKINLTTEQRKHAIDIPFRFISLAALCFSFHKSSSMDNGTTQGVDQLLNHLRRVRGKDGNP